MQALVDVRIASPGDRTHLVAALSSAFHDDPVYRWVSPDDEQRRAGLSLAFDRFADAVDRHGASHCAGDGIGAALWVPPGEQVADDEGAFGAALVEQLRAGTDRVVALASALRSARPGVPHWYLPLIGVIPEAQGQGVGGALLTDALRRCDEERVAVGLAATSPANRRLFERHGFVVTQELRLPDGGPSLWAMWRR